MARSSIEQIRCTLFYKNKIKNKKQNKTKQKQNILV